MRYNEEMWVVGASRLGRHFVENEGSKRCDFLFESFGFNAEVRISVGQHFLLLKYIIKFGCRLFGKRHVLSYARSYMGTISGSTKSFRLNGELPNRESRHTHLGFFLFALLYLLTIPLGSCPVLLLLPLRDLLFWHVHQRDSRSTLWFGCLRLEASCLRKR